VCWLYAMTISPHGELFWRLLRPPSQPKPQQCINEASGMRGAASRLTLMCNTATKSHRRWWWLIHQASLSVWVAVLPQTTRSAFLGNQQQWTFEHVSRERRELVSIPRVLWTNVERWAFAFYFPCWCLVDQMTPHSPLFLSVLLLKCFVCLIAAPTKHKTYTIKWAISIQGFFVICGEFLLSNMFIMHIFIKTKTIQACSNRSTLEETNKQLMWSSSIWFWGGSWVFILIALSSMPKSILLIVRQTTQQSTK